MIIAGYGRYRFGDGLNNYEACAALYDK